MDKNELLLDQIQNEDIEKVLVKKVENGFILSSINVFEKIHKNFVYEKRKHNDTDYLLELFQDIQTLLGISPEHEYQGSRRINFIVEEYKNYDEGWVKLKDENEIIEE